MFRSLVALSLAASSPLAAAAPTEMGDWALATMPHGCMVQAVSPHGTMLSIWAFAGQGRFGFLLQNRDWAALRDGERYRLSLDFVGVRAWPVDATARTAIDRDGPGFFFTVTPGGSGGDGFIDALASAEGMAIRRDGQAVDTLPLAGSRGAMASLARCLAEKWSVPDAAPAAEPEASEADTVVS
jgi:hypothetical protein